MLEKLDQTKDSDAIGFFTSEHLRMSGSYWAIGSHMMLNNPLETRREETIRFVKSCQHPCGGFGGNLNHDPHITTSLYALLIMAMFDAVTEINTESLAQYLAKL
jgi:geranylgeranyl transferase type-2 subunit beta